MDDGGKVVFKDPSVLASGPSAGVIARDEFLHMLGEEDLCPVWVIAGEKGAYGAASGVGGDSFVGRMVHSAVYSLGEAGNVVRLGLKEEIERGAQTD